MALLYWVLGRWRVVGWLLGYFFRSEKKNVSELYLFVSEHYEYTNEIDWSNDEKVCDGQSV